ncbi:hypothetical protein MDA_GLEAN10025589 [Myotis davidii]|uniref:Uncharacterized protein n=1 Tax=Myotis davidii TaxID=225400 RepID=L5LMZ0_MYODS|nr:hypothetical protein MDA_GLEAN10025589 [Myotis davidii]
MRLPRQILEFPLFLRSSLSFQLNTASDAGHQHSGSAGSGCNAQEHRRLSRRRADAVSPFEKTPGKITPSLQGGRKVERRGPEALPGTALKGAEPGLQKGRCSCQAGPERRKLAEGAGPEESD